MKLHAVEAALTLYESGTYTLETAARQAGTTPARLRDSLARRGFDLEELSPEQVRRIRAAAD